MEPIQNQLEWLHTLLSPKKIQALKARLIRFG
jgi:hypothetical protein